MKKQLLTALVLAAVVCPNVTLAAVKSNSAVGKANAGRILLDVANHGEAWYVNPATNSRTYLGRPEEALGRLLQRTVSVSFADIEKVALDGQTAGDAEYSKAHRGEVLFPNDLVGAGWYVHPTFDIRLRLATAEDAWLVLRTGIPTDAKTLAAIPVETDTVVKPAGVVKVAEVESADVVKLSDGTRIRLIAVDTPSNPDLQAKAVARIKADILATESCSVEGDRQDVDASGLKLRYLQCGEILVNHDLIREGLAFHNVTFPNYKHAETFIVGGLDAMHNKKGFWNK